jgi:murein DD-endopeptidase MepM/ murein hydrolase activator NlpD
MRFAVSGQYRRVLSRGAAVFLMGGLAAGCSSDVMRFEESIFTGSSHGQQPQQQSAQAYPGDYANVDQTSTGSIAPAPRRGGLLNRLVPRPQNGMGGQQAAQGSWNAPQQPTYSQAPQPVYSQPTYPVSSGPALAPVVRQSLDNTSTGAIQPVRTAVTQPTIPQAAPQIADARPIPTSNGEAGWTRAGGTQVSVKPGETVFNLSRRFGVPTDAILKANGMSDASQLAAGQQVVIPTYVHSARAPVSAPDANPRVADARSSTGSRSDLPNAPLPGSPGDRVAVLPQQQQLREPQAGSAAAAPTPQAGGTYKVVSGDTLNAIARKHGVTADAVKRENGMSDGIVRIGQTLKIRGGASGGTQVVAAPTPVTAPKAAEQPKVATYTPPKNAADSSVQTASIDRTTPAPSATGISGMRWPVRGRVTSGFGSSAGKKNDGIDIAVPAGTPIKAAENGVVIYAGDGLKEFGNTVLVRHENGLVTVYGHASELKVQRGQKVRRGEDLALAGMSGSADTPKLHFEVRKDSTPVDPTKYLE